MKVAVAFGLCVILFTAFNDRGLPALMKARRQSAELTAEIARMRVVNARLRARAELLRSDGGTIERLARETLGLARADELVVRAIARPSGDR